MEFKSSTFLQLLLLLTLLTLGVASSVSAQIVEVTIPDDGVVQELSLKDGSTMYGRVTDVGDPMTFVLISGIELNPNNSGKLKLRAYPNPFTESTEIHFNLDKPSVVSLSVYNIFGNTNIIVNNRYFNEGNHKITVDSEGLPNGVFFFNLIVNNKIQTGKFILIK